MRCSLTWSRILDAHSNVEVMVPVIEPCPNHRNINNIFDISKRSPSEVSLKDISLCQFVVVFNDHSLVESILFGEHTRTQ